MTESMRLIINSPLRRRKQTIASWNFFLMSSIVKYTLECKQLIESPLFNSHSLFSVFRSFFYPPLYRYATKQNKELLLFTASCNCVWFSCRAKTGAFYGPFICSVRTQKLSGVRIAKATFYEKHWFGEIFAEPGNFNEPVCNNGCQCCDESVVLTDKQLLENTSRGYCHIHGWADYAGHSHVEYLIYIVVQQLRIDLYVRPAVPEARGHWRTVGGGVQKWLIEEWWGNFLHRDPTTSSLNSSPPLWTLPPSLGVVETFPPRDPLHFPLQSLIWT